jgi:hypothetical protein
VIVYHLNSFAYFDCYIFRFCRQHYPLVEEWILGNIMRHSGINGASDTCSYYHFLLLEYLSCHNRFTDFWGKAMETVRNPKCGFEQVRLIAWLHDALDCATNQTIDDLPQKLAVVHQIQQQLDDFLSETRRDKDSSTPQHRARSASPVAAHSETSKDVNKK